MRVLHLIDAVSPQATATTLALLAESLGQTDHVQNHPVLLGGTDLTRASQAAGLENTTTLGTPFGHALLAWSRVRRYAQLHGPFNLIHCWSVGTLSLATMLFRNVPRVCTLTLQPSQRSIGWIRAMSRESGNRTTLLPISNTIRQALLGRGVPPSAVHVLRPGINMGRIHSGNRQDLRRGWDAQSENIKVIAILNDPPTIADPSTLATALMMADSSAPLAKIELRLLVHPSQAKLLQIAQSMKQIGLDVSIIQEPKLSQPWSILPGCDLGLALGDHAGGLALLWAMASNVPIIGDATYAVSEIVEDHHSALLTQPHSATSIAHRITQLVCDPQLSWQLRDTARHEAYSYFSCQQYSQSLKTVYQQVVEGQEVEVPAMEATGGLRFSGRA